MPPTDEVCGVFKEALARNYKECDVRAVACPDLRDFGLAAAGLGGEAHYAECGTIHNAMFNPDRQHDVYTLGEVSTIMGRPDSFVVGSGAGSTAEFGVNSEWTGNAILQNSEVTTNLSRVAYVTDMNQLPKPYTVRMADNRGQVGCIGNLLFTEGKPAEEVIQVSARFRRAERNWSEDPHDQEFIRILRTALAEKYPQMTKHVVYGGVVLVLKGRTVTHVMPPYFPPAGAKPGKSFPDMGGWAECFYYSDNKLVGATTLMNHQGAGLPKEHGQYRLDHTHFFTQDNKEAGHYHYDVSPEEIEYVAFLVPAKTVTKVDKIVADMPKL